MKEVLKEHVRLVLVLANKTSASILLLAKVYMFNPIYLDLLIQFLIPSTSKFLFCSFFSFFVETCRCFSLCKSAIYITESEVQKAWEHRKSFCFLKKKKIIKKGYMTKRRLCFRNETPSDVLCYVKTKLKRKKKSKRLLCVVN